MENVAKGPIGAEKLVGNTAKSYSEAFIRTSTNPQYDKRLFIKSPVQYRKMPSSEHVELINCS